MMSLSAADHNSDTEYLLNPYQILLVGLEAAGIFTPLIADLPLPTRVVHAATGEEALNWLQEKPVGVLVSDHFLADMTGVDLIKTVRRLGLGDVYTILLIADEVYGRVLALNSRFAIDSYLTPTQNHFFNLSLLRQALNGRSPHLLKR
ncbi:MAG: hypothetical protein H6658_18225 [Ardenticatenaceae bacterium]|nr:hypothetical protein [Ardenticatenaceae bacterium]